MTISMDADALLMRRLGDGDDLALNELMNRWRERVACFLLRMVGDHATAMDLTHECFVRLYGSRHRYKPAASFSTYLFQIAANLARSHARWKGRHPTVSLTNADGSLAHDPHDPQLPPDGAAALHEKTALVSKAIAALPGELREALMLFTLEDMSHAEIAAALGCSPKAVEVRIYRARQALKESLAGLV